jgi:hypothetical protein
VVEAQGEGIPEALASLQGVDAHEATAVENRIRVSLEGEGDQELRPEIFTLARERGWVLWELHRERASLEDVFRQLTSEREEVLS